MKLLVTFVLLIMLPSIAAADWKVAAEKLRASIVYMETSQGSCTGFVIDEEKDLVLTAAHCYDELKNIFIDNKPVAKVVARDTKKDLLVLHVPDLDRPALALAKDGPKVGDEVGSYGFGYGLEEPLFKAHHVAAANLDIDVENIGGPLIAVDTEYVGGMSGGPLVNKEGEVVGVVQRGTSAVGFGVDAETIRDKVGRYFSLK